MKNLNQDSRLPGPRIEPGISRIQSTSVNNATTTFGLLMFDLLMTLMIVASWYLSMGSYWLLVWGSLPERSRNFPPRHGISITNPVSGPIDTVVSCLWVKRPGLKLTVHLNVIPPLYAGPILIFRSQQFERWRVWEEVTAVALMNV
jgi:hypothetical protein